MRRNALILFLLLTSSRVSFAQKRVYVNEYLNIGLGARGLAMGGAVAASTSDVTAGFWNPAGLQLIKNDWQVGLMHAEYFAGNSKYDYAGVAIPLKGRNRTIGISGLRFATDDIAYTIDYVQPDGSFDESKLKSISAGDYAFLLSYAQDLNIKAHPGIKTRIGANAKIIYRNIGSMANAWGAGLDLGLQSSVGQWRLGLMLKDITTTYTAWSFHLTEREKEVFGQTHNEIPVKSYEVMTPRINLGIARYLTKPGKALQLLLELDGDITTDGQRNTLVSNADFSLDPHAGLEASYKNIIYLRLGVSNFQRVLDDKDSTNQAKYTLWQPSAGAGLHIAGLNIDYAYTSLQTQSNPLFSDIISVRCDIQGKRKKSKEQTTDTHSAVAPAENK
ncbi:MAG: PorV/PorQ family protein [Bacteroidetes bacterium]|nr:PorV/PorQ family protein [Bacteroidota bacterium]